MLIIIFMYKLLLWRLLYEKTYRLSAIIERFGLRKPIYKQLSAYGHMGREDTGVLFEKTDMAQSLKALLG